MHLEIRGFVNDGDRVLEIPLDLSEHLARDYKDFNPLPSLVDTIAIVISPAKDDTDSKDKKENE